MNFALFIVLISFIKTSTFKGQISKKDFQNAKTVIENIANDKKYQNVSVPADSLRNMQNTIARLKCLQKEAETSNLKQLAKEINGSVSTFEKVYRNIENAKKN